MSDEKAPASAIAPTDDEIKTALVNYEAAVYEVEEGNIDTRREELLAVLRLCKDARDTLSQSPRTFSDFIRNASPEEKEAVYTEVMQKASERQAVASSTEAAPEVPAQGASEGLSGADVRSATVIPPATAAASTSTDLAFCPACEKEWQRDTASSTEEPVAWAVVHTDGDPREANSIHWEGASRHNGGAEESARKWAKQFGFSVVPLYASPITASAIERHDDGVWNLSCPQCGASPDGDCGWPTNCPTGLNRRADSASEK